MDFTYDSYIGLINGLKDKGYSFCTYSDHGDYDRCVILRHDVDEDLDKALKLADIENDLGVSSVYFALLTSDFYNLFSKDSFDKICKIQSLGHSIGLHFDEVRYPEISGDTEAIRDKILYEAGLLGQITGSDTEYVSMHRPSKGLLESDLKIPGMINAYSHTFMKEFKYISDSRRRWREPVDDIIAEGSYDRLHILTHPIWYTETEKDTHSVVTEWVNSANLTRYDHLNDNITNLSEIMDKSDVIR